METFLVLLSRFFNLSVVVLLMITGEEDNDLLSHSPQGGETEG